MPGEALSNVMINKLPFAAPGDPLVEARCEAIEAPRRQPVLRLLGAAAVIKLKQGFGRLIRTHADRGVVGSSTRGC